MNDRTARRPIRADTMSRTPVRVAITLVLLGATAMVPAATIVVDTVIDNLSVDGNCSLREAVTAANNDSAVDGCTAGSGADTIILPPGTYELSIAGTGENNAVTGDLDLRSDMTIRGATADLSIVDGGGIDRVFHVDPGNDDIAVTLEDLTVTNGVNADAENGGGIESFASGVGELQLSRVVVSENSSAGVGGGIYVDGNLTLFHSAIRGNSSDDGAGIFVEGGSTVFLNFSEVSGNTSSTSAGGINNNGDLTLARALVAGNTATQFKGGGLLNNTGATTLAIDSTFSGNVANEVGGAIQNNDSVVLRRVTITDNTGVLGGGGIQNEMTLMLNHTILAANPGGNCGGDAPVSAGYNLEDADTCGLDQTGDQVDTDPQLGPLADNGGPTRTHALPASSPALDAGDSAAALTVVVDQRFAPRISPGTVGAMAVLDIGAYEHSLPLVVTSTGDGNDALPGDGICEVLTGTGVCTLRAAVQEANSVPRGLSWIELPAGTFALAIAGAGENDAATGDLDIRDSVVISGAGADQTIIDGADLDRVFDLRADQFILDATFIGLKVRNGTAVLGGCIGSFRDGYDLSLSLDEVVIEDCTATSNGGALQLETGALAWIVDSILRNNQSANLGGAIQSEFDSRLVVRRSELSGNTTGGSGGAMESGFVTLYNSTLSGNTANNAGAIFAGGVTAIVSSTLANNTATSGQVGAVWANGQTLFHNSILADNNADPATQNCEDQRAVSLGFNVEDADSCSLTAATDLVNTDPQLGPLADNGGLTQTQALPAASPAVDSGGDDFCPDTDQRGFARPADGDANGSELCDRGAYERGAVNPDPFVFADGFENPMPPPP